LDIVSQKKRSKMMSGIQGKDTKPELIVRKGLFGRGFRYRLHEKQLPGKPDLVFPKYKTVIHVNGCFWHGHDCPRGKRPSTNTEFWNEKLSRNVERDRSNCERLKAEGWGVAIVWECEIKKLREHALFSLLEADTS